MTCVVSFRVIILAVCTGLLLGTKKVFVLIVFQHQSIHKRIIVNKTLTNSYIVSNNGKKHLLTHIRFCHMNKGVIWYISSRLNTNAIDITCTYKDAYRLPIGKFPNFLNSQKSQINFYLRGGGGLWCRGKIAHQFCMSNFRMNKLVIHYQL